MIAHQHVLIVALVRIVAVFDPLLLNEFELAREAGVESHEDDAAIVSVRCRLSFRGGKSIGKSAAGNAAAIDEPSIESESIARMNAPNVRADGTACSFEVRAIREVGVAIRILDNGLVRSIRGKLDGCSIS